MFRLIIAGGREFSDYPLLAQNVEAFVNELDDPEIEIVCGCARGADSLGEEYGKSKGYKINYYKPNWDLYGRSAGMIRNNQMAQNADGLVAFWDGSSKGTKNMIDLARRRGLKVKVVMYKE